jgi:uncharacterized protein YlzI (FlbEa/FlbD family)
MKYIKNLLNKLDDIYYQYLYKTFLWRVRYFFESIKNLIKWLPIIFKDRDWDHTFILRILCFKLKQVRIRYEKNELFVGQENEIKWLKMCEYLLNYINTSKGWEDEEESKYLNTKNIESIKKWPQVIDISHHKCDLREEKAEKLFWKIISWRCNYWWD